MIPPQQKRDIDSFINASRPPHIEPHHYQEWVIGSRIDPEITALNLRSLSSAEAYDYLLYSDQLPRRNDGRLTQGFLRSYRHVEQGGWWCGGVNVLNPTLEANLWGCFKPNAPRLNSDKGKVIKYEHPPKVNTEIFALRVPDRVWDRIATRHQLKRYHSPLALRLQDRQQPVSFWEWEIKTPELPLLVTEGAKKAGALLTAGYAAIALPGIYGGYRQLKDKFGNKIGKAALIPQLEIFAQEGREVVFVFDRDTKPKTIADVRQAILKTGKLLQQKGCKISVVVWNYPEKGADDLIAARGAEYFHTLYRDRISLEEFQLHHLLDVSPYVSLQVNQRYLGSAVIGQPLPVADGHQPLVEPPPEAQIISIKSAKGTGKTEYLTGIVEDIIEQGERTLVLSHREQLAIANGNRLGIDYRKELLLSVTRGVFGYALCVDSLHSNANPPFNPEHWEGASVVIDEAEQVIWHLLDSKTCMRNRVAILKCFKELLQTVIATEGKIYLADADLSPIALEFIRQLSGATVAPWVIENVHNPNQGKRRLHVYEGSNPSGLVASLVKAVHDGEKPFIVTGAQKLKSKWGTQNLEAYLKKRFPAARILRIDSESVSDPKHPAYGCMGNLNALLPMFDIVIASPTLETGVSIDIRGHFTSVWAIAQGVQTVEAVCQALERVRDDVPRHLWASLRGLEKVGNGATSVKALLTSQEQLFKANMRLLTIAGASDDEFDDLDPDFQPESLMTWARRACVVNLGMRHYREFIIKKLIKEGYEIVAPGDGTEDEAEKLAAADQVKTEIKETQQENYQQHCEEVAAAAPLSETEQASLDRKQAKTKGERQRERKGQLVKRYGDDVVTPELVEKDDKGWYPKLRQHYSLTDGAEFVSPKDRRTLKAMAESGEGALFKPDVNKRLRGARNKTLELINLKQFLAPEREFSSSSLADWFKLIASVRYDIRDILGITINPSESPIKVAQRFLAQLLGLKLNYVGKRGARGQQERVYQGCSPNPDGRQKIFDGWLERDLALLEQTGQAGNSPVVRENVADDTVSTPSNNTYIKPPAMDTVGEDTSPSEPNIAPSENQPLGKEIEPPPSVWQPQEGEEVLIFTPESEMNRRWSVRGIVKKLALHASDCWEVLVDGCVKRIWDLDWLIPAPEPDST